MSYTDLFITVDTHQSPLTTEEEVKMRENLMGAIKELYTKATLMRVLTLEDPQKLRSAQMLAAAVEKGGKRHTIHAHFNLNLVHDTKIILCDESRGVSLNKNLANFFSGHLAIPGCFASAALQNSSKAKNYNSRGGSLRVPDITRHRGDERGQNDDGEAGSDPDNDQGRGRGIPSV